ncbi:hypothetical protein CONCODRAFT_109194 [Conidiobolus coronatus NRRL 28638]|uniref:Mos1 transposase HTH domain-containing protein n=1 Tax=Conidiobolus coronatus (strain ATCC 28846 / CBS 209.66 / NRRL 28638) TaxID=796925 RepID=A0A137NZG6_CONC2|nr:hypothetical protein CONCODRAFT_109194 [Conidiobolus coronatus NRRL 28638]|eukprot:KXN68024.1 hypothetical protein CONCODRAFT_109194 [Conidiobolus coronatus NRRL 28638]
MSTEINIIRQALLELFNQNKTEIEAFEELSKSNNAFSVSLNLVKKWFRKFRAEKRDSANKKNPGIKPNFTNEFLIMLVNENPELNLSGLAKLAGTSRSTVSSRIKEINIDGEKVIYKKKSYQRGTERVTEEFVINLIKENPGLNLSELAKLADTSQSTISVRLRQINSNRPDDDKLILQKGVGKVKNSPKTISDEDLITLVNENPEFSMEKLANISGTSTGYISTRLKQLNSKEKVVNYNSKKSKLGTTKLTDESLINLIKQNPGLNSYELAKLADTSQPTISLRLRKINSTRSDDNKLILQRSITKLPKKSKSISDEFIINLVNSNPGLNMKELAKLGYL